jgi:hypothetical protein
MTALRHAWDCPVWRFHRRAALALASLALLVWLVDRAL